MSDELFKFTSGPRTARVMLVGEAWGESEDKAKRPFCGYSGIELDRMLGEAGLARNQFLCTNVVSARPPGNDFTHFLFPTVEAKKNADFFGVHPRPQLAAGLRRLYDLIDLVRPELIVAAGNWPLFALTSHTTPSTVKGYKLPAGILTWRGSQTWLDHAKPAKLGSALGQPGHKLTPVLPIVHPAAITRAWYLRSPTVHDLRARAGRFLAGTGPWNAPPLNATWRPSLGEVDRALNLWLAQACHRKLKLSVDIETYAKRFIACIGISDERSELCIPFFWFEDRGLNHLSTVPYWKLEDELAIWMRLRSLLEHPNVEIIGQNFMYDSLFLARYGINALVHEDTMIMHHLLYPGTPKALHYISSLYCNYYCYWKDESEEWAASALSAENLWFYNCKDLRYTFECAEVLRSLVKRAGLETHLAWRMREWRLARKMSLRGINDDGELRRQYTTDVLAQAMRAQQYLLDIVPERWKWGGKGVPWFNSPKATMDFLYRDLGLQPILHKKTKRPTIDDAAIEELINRPAAKWLEPVLRRVQALRSMGVFRSHFLDIKLGPGKRFYTQFNVAHPETFRWSSSATPLGEGTNAQNIPKIEVD